MSSPVSLPAPSGPAAAMQSAAGEGGRAPATGEASVFDALVALLSPQAATSGDQTAASTASEGAKDDTATTDSHTESDTQAGTTGDQTSADAALIAAQMTAALVVPANVQPAAQPVANVPDVAADTAPAAAPEMPETALPPTAGDEDAFADLMEKAGKSGTQAQDTDPSGGGDPGTGGQDAQPKSFTASLTPRAEAKAALEATREAMSDVASTGSQADASLQAMDAPAATATAKTPDPAAASPFSLQATADTPGSYTAAGASAAAGSNLSRATVETMSALSMQISKSLKEGNTKFAMELYPADLGKVEVSLTIARDGRTTAHLSFDSPVTAATFSARESELRQQLSQSGLTFDGDSLSFSSRDGGGSFASSQDQGQSQAQSSYAARALKASGTMADEADHDAALDAAIAARSRTPSTLALNLIV